MSARVLIVRQDSIGDVLLAGPAIRAVAAAGAEVTLLCGPRGRAAAELLPGVDELITWRADWIDPEPEPIDAGAVARLVERLSGCAFDEALILTSSHQSPLPMALLLRLAGVGRIAAISEDYPGSLLDVRQRDPGDVHEVTRALSTVAAAGYELPTDDDGALRVRRTAAALHPAAAWLSPYVVVHPGASVPARAWSLRRYRELIDLLEHEGWNVVVTGARAERALTAEVSGTHGSRVLDLGGATDLPQLAEVLAGAEAAIVANTGPAHLAAAVGVPVVSIYAPTVPAARWHPWGVPFELLHREVPCAGCRARVCPVEGHPCIEPLEAEDVAQALERLTLSSARARPVAGAGEAMLP